MSSATPRPFGDGDDLSLDKAFEELRQTVLGDLSMSETLHQVATLTRRVVPQAAEVSVTLVEGERARTAAFTGSIAVQLDERQYAAGFGPCLAAAISGQTIRTDSDDPDTAYPDFARVAGRSGMRHTLSVALPVPGRTVGALNLYGAGSMPFDDLAESTVGTFAGYAAVSIANAALYADAVDLATQLRVAMASRAEIEQAKGIVMAQQGCTAEEAFAMLARLSQTRNVKLREIAHEVVHHSTAQRRQASP